MSRFNPTTEQTRLTTNIAGGKAYIQNPEVELILILLSSFAQDKFYKSFDNETDSLTQLLLWEDEISIELATKAIIYARKEFGMRSISHIAAKIIWPRLSTKKGSWKFYRDIIHRPDDMAEIASLFKGKLPAAIRKGFKAAFDKFSNYQLRKYLLKGKSVNMCDLVRICHPRSTERNAEALQDIIENYPNVHPAETWEVALTQAGNDVKAKTEAWNSLVIDNKLGYFALLRNLRNILEHCCPEVIEEAALQLQNESMIRKSLVLPFRFTIAFDIIKNLTLPSGSRIRTMLQAIEKAADISCCNIPKLSGENLIAIDVSASMWREWIANKVTPPIQHASILGAAIAKSTNADILLFDGEGRYLPYSLSDTVLNIRNSIISTGRGGCTNFDAIFDTANKAYDRIIILSDMQGWAENLKMVETSKPTNVSEYRSKYSCTPMIYCIDLAGYGTGKFPEKSVMTLGGFSDKLLDLIQLTENGSDAMIKRILNYV